MSIAKKKEPIRTRKEAHRRRGDKRYYPQSRCRQTESLYRRQCGNEDRCSRILIISCSLTKGYYLSTLSLPP